jgi:hypothetical protein
VANRVTDLLDVIGKFKNLGAYLGSFSQKIQPTRFEHLSCKSFSCLLGLPFFDSSNDDASIPHRVVWRGIEQTWVKAPEGADGLAHAHGFCIVIEATLRRNRTQWSHEFVPCVNHYNEFLASTGITSTNCYLLLLVTKLNNYTFASIKQKVTEGCRFIILPVHILTDILETYALAFTATHSDLKVLLDKLIDCLGRSVDIDDFMQRLDDETRRWKKELLDNERRVFVGAKSYRSLNRRGGYGSLSEIFSDLYGDSVVKEFFTQLGRPLETSDIETSLNEERLAYRAQNVLRDVLYSSVPFQDIESRAKILIKELEDATTS